MGYLKGYTKDNKRNVALYDAAANKFKDTGKIRFVTPSSRFADGNDLTVSFVVFYNISRLADLSALLSQFATNEDIHLVQKHRSPVEHAVKNITRFRVLQDNRVSEVETLETMLDVCMGINNANKMIKHGLEGQIPLKPHRAAERLRMITPTADANLKLGKLKRLSQTPNYFQEFREFLRGCTILRTHEGAHLQVPADDEIRALRSNTMTLETRPTVLKRSKSLFESGFLLFVQVCKFSEIEGAFMVRFTVGASFLQTSHMVTIILTQDRIIKKYCICGMG
jgi:hypothetical protein